MQTTIDPNCIPAVLRSSPQWVLWRYEVRDGKRTKPPFQADGRHASHSDPRTWDRWKYIWEAYQRGGWEGVGYVLTAEDRVAGVDLDHAIDADTGEVQPWALEIVRRLNSYTEISPSGRGLRIFLFGSLPAGAPRGGRKLNRPEGGAIELYAQLRYLTVTGRRLPESPETLEPRETELHALYHELFGEEPARALPLSAPAANGNGHGPSLAAAAVTGHELPDAELLARMFAARNGAAITALWIGDTSACGGDDSRADLALCSHLAFWTNGDADRMDRLFRQSRLYREKWERADYRQATLDRALSDAGEGYVPARTFVPEGTTTRAQETDAAARALEAARGLVMELPVRLQTDIGSVYAPEMLQALGLLRARDPSGWLRAKKLLQDRKVPLRPLERHLPPVGQFLAALELQESADGRRAGESLPDCPCPELVIPEPYWVRPDGTGTIEIDDEGRPVSRTFAFAPILISARLHDIDEGTEALRVTSRRPATGWQPLIVDRATALDGRKLVELASSGFPVAGDNARAVAKYLHRLEAANFHRLRCAKISSHLGWQGDHGAEGFLWGHQLITPAGEMTDAIRLDDLAPEEWREDWVTFRGASAGDEQIAEGFHALGDLSRYLQIISPIQHYPRVALAWYASFLAPLLQILGAPNPIIDWGNRTSTGKTVTLRLGASVWGKPDEKAPDGALGTWDSTRVWLERASYVLSALPVILDDTKRARTPQSVADLLYTVASGRGRGRGSVRGLARTRTWRTVLLSSGEAPATAFTQDGGTRARVLSVRGIPFSRDDAATRLVVDALNVGIQTHYGLAGPAFVRWLYRQRHRWEEFAAEYHRCVDAYAAQATTSVAGRMAHHAAALDVTAALVHAALELPWEYRDPLEQLWAGIIDEASDAAGAVRALQDVVSWAHAHESRFYGRHIGLFDIAGDPPGGWAGCWPPGDWETLAFFPTVLSGFLREMRYEPEAILADWKERGWLWQTPSETSRYETRIAWKDRHRPRMVAIQRAAIEEVEA